MTNEEAIKNVTYMRDSLDPLSERKLIESLDLAIEALRKQNAPDTNDGDTVSRQAAIKDAESWVAVDEHEKHLQKNVVEWLKELPSAEQPNSSEFPNNSDTVYRQALLDAFGLSEKTRKYGGDHSGYNTMMLYEIQDVIEGMPSAEPKRGKWIRDGHHIRCDQCGMYMCDTDREGDRIPTEFCPSCLAKMDGEYDG